MGLFNTKATGAAAAKVAASAGQTQTGVNKGFTGSPGQMGPGGDVMPSRPTTTPSGPSKGNSGGNSGGTVAPGTRTPGGPTGTSGTAGSPSGTGGNGSANGNPNYVPGLGDTTGMWKYYDPNAGSSGGGSSGGGSSGGGKPKSGVSADELLDQQLFEGGENVGDGGNAGDGEGSGSSSGGNPYKYLAAGAPTAYKLPELGDPNPERINHVDTETLRGMLQQIVDTQKEQSQKSIDYNVERGTNELNRAMEDAANEYQTQRDQISADEANALDNQALYSEARGDRGGIGEAQYASIQNTAAQNRRAVNDAQVKLGTDTARQISDLRSQGEFEKADQLLSITQSYLSQLMNLEQWALSTNLGVDEFNSQLQQWVDEYNLGRQKYLADLELSAAQLTGMFSDGTRTLAAQNELINSLAASGNALLEAGVMPSRQQLEAMGLTETQAKAYLTAKGIKF